MSPTVLPSDRRLLAIAFHFPPIQGSSGVHRTLAFARYLDNFHWKTTILTASPRAYTRVRAENEQLVPAFVDVVRAPALDTVRHLSIGGRYSRWMALPDRWQSWIPGAVAVGLLTIWRQKPSAILSTFPIASAHAIGLALSRLSGLPWIADFRDPMDQITYPANPDVRRSYRWLEERAFRNAARILVTTPGTADYYTQRYGQSLGRKIRVIPNGFDEEAFPAGFSNNVPPLRPAGNRPLTLVHSGILYPKERDPEPFLRALAALRASGKPGCDAIRIVFRGSAHGDHFTELVRNLNLQDAVTFPPALPYREAIAEMLAADALLVFQADNCNAQIPAKVYEYLFAGRPIIGIADPAGDTGQLLTSLGATYVAKLEDQSAIADVLGRAIEGLRAGIFPLPGREAVMTLSRRVRTAELATVLDAVVAGEEP
ncbi:MAG: glycosyltransferase [Gammaproteobacteria bacterium]